MPICLGCNGSRQQWVDWAEDYAPCFHCNGQGVISDKDAINQQRAMEKARRNRRKKNPGRWNHYRGYRIQSVKLHWTDWDTVGCEEWNTIRVVETLDYGVYLVEKMNEPYEDHDYGPPYRLVSPNGRVVNRLGVEGGQAFSERHFPVPGEY